MDESKNQSLRNRDGNIVNNWYIACLSQELKTSPIARTIYDTSYVLFRDENSRPVALLNRCLHRLTQMQTGKVIDGKLACPYHGWQYNNHGNVVHIPSEGPDQKIQDKHCQKTLPCIEQDGCIWVWMGEGHPTTATPPWRFPFWDDNSWTKYFMITDFENEVTNLCENFMDVPHTIYVHKDWFRNQAYKKVPMSVETKNARVLVTYKQEKDKIAGPLYRLLNPKLAPMKHTDEYIYPNITRVDYTFNNEYGFIINSQNTPVKTLNSRVYTYICYKMAGLNKLIKPFIHYYTRQVIEQDVRIMKEQSRSLEIDPTLNFRSTPADELHIQIERLRHLGKIGSDQLFKFEDIKEKEFWI